MSASMAELLAKQIIAHLEENGDRYDLAYSVSIKRLAIDVAAHQAEVLAANGYGKLEDATRLIRDLTDPDDCWFDHHGGCQAHGYLSLEPGEMCPQLEAKAWVARAVTERGGE